MDHFTLRDGQLYAEDVPLAAIAAAVGTPVYVYAQATMTRHVQVFRDAVAALGDPLIAYAVKANPNGAVLSVLARAGCGADVVSVGELLRARAAGIPAEGIVFSGVGKTADEMAVAVDHDIGQFNLECETEAEMLSQVAVARGRRARVAFRVNPDVDAGTHAKISTGRADNKFGILIDGARAAFARAAALPGLDVQGVALHIGSQLTDLGPLETAFTQMGALIAELRADGHDIRTADFGGGLGIPYQPGRPLPPSPQAYGAMVARLARDWRVRAIFEPGRLIVGNAGVLVAQVIRVKPGAVNPWVIVDAGMNDLLRPSLYDAWHDIRAVHPREGKMVANVVGPVCESGDTFALARPMEQVAPGDLVAFMTAGAYAAAMASTYNSRALTPEVMVSGDRWAVVRAREPLDALIAADRIPPWLALPSHTPERAQT